MKELHSFAWYAARVTPHLPKEAFKPVPARLWGGLIYVLITIAGFLIIGFFDIHPVLSVLISIVIGSSFAALGFLGH
ncbi:MAG TPA: acyl-CoA desaturase, partial [Pseudoneobacillus sp.]|nr:acyl-CoA desaturase [Pseudoneobacillus sp.]